MSANSAERCGQLFYESDKMKLYHFTAKRHVPDIRKHGITIGGVLVSADEQTIDKRWRWLTENPSFDQPSLIGTGTLPYKRNEARITIIFPDNIQFRIYKWAEIGSFISQEYELLNKYSDYKNWYLYLGDVPPEYITKIKYKRR